MIHVKPLKLSDDPDNIPVAMNRLLGVLVGKQGENLLSINDILDGLTDENSFTFVAEDDAKGGSERFVGIGVIFFEKVYSGWKAEIHDVVVDKTCRGQGVGTELMKALIRQAQECAISRKISFQLSLTNNPKRGNGGFYCKLGFKLIAKAHGENGTNLYRMTITP